MGLSSTRVVDNFVAGRTHLRHEASIAVHANIRQILVDAMHDHVGHALVLAHGLFQFRAVIARELGGYFDGNRAQLDRLSDVMFRFLEKHWPDVLEQYGIPRTTTPRQFLDAVDEVSPPTEQEIDDAWELEIAGSESAMRQMYEGSQRTRKGNDLGIKRRD